MDTLEAPRASSLLAGLGEVGAWEVAQGGDGLREVVAEALSCDCGCSQGQWCDAHVWSDAIACEEVLAAWMDGEMSRIAALDWLTQLLLQRCVCANLRECEEHCREDAWSAVEAAEAVEAVEGARGAPS